MIKKKSVTIGGIIILSASLIGIAQQVPTPTPTDPPMTTFTPTPSPSPTATPSPTPMMSPSPTPSTNDLSRNDNSEGWLEFLLTKIW